MSRRGGRPGEAGRLGTVAGLLGAVLLCHFALPLAALATQSPGSVFAVLARPAVVRAGWHTLVTALASTALATALGVPLAYWLARADPRVRGPVTALVVFPLALPPVVAGMLLLGLVGDLAGSLPAVVLAQTFVAAPFVVLSATSALRGVDPDLEEAAWTQGASEFRTARRVTLPLASRGIAAGVTLAFARAAGEFGATLMLAYSAGTLPVEIWVAFQRDGLDGAFPVALVLVALALAALAALRALGAGLTVWTE